MKVSIDWSICLWVDGRGWTSIGQGGSEEDIFENTDQLFPFSYTRCSIRLIGFRAIDLFLTINCSGIWRRKKHFFLVEKFRKMLIMEICDITWAVLYTVYTICELNDWMVLVSPLLCGWRNLTLLQTAIEHYWTLLNTIEHCWTLLNTIELYWTL